MDIYMAEQMLLPKVLPPTEPTATTGLTLASESRGGWWPAAIAVLVRRTTSAFLG